MTEPNRGRIQQSSILVTGATRGLGHAIVRKLSRAGVNVIIGAKTVESAKLVQEEVRSLTGNVPEFLCMDLNDIPSLQRACASLRAHTHTLQAIINNAGVFSYDQDDLLEHLDAKTASEIITVNALAPLLLVSELHPLLVASEWGHIINITSDMSEFVSMDGEFTAYRMSKVALNALTVNLAAHFRGTPIRVSAIDPGWMRTDMGGPEGTEDPEEVAEVVLWLLQSTLQLPDTASCWNFSYQQASWWQKEILHLA